VVRREPRGRRLDYSCPSRNLNSWSDASSSAPLAKDESTRARAKRPRRKIMKTIAAHSMISNVIIVTCQGARRPVSSHITGQEEYECRSRCFRRPPPWWAVSYEKSHTCNHVRLYRIATAKSIVETTYSGRCRKWGCHRPVCGGNSCGRVGEVCATFPNVQIETPASSRGRK
jgi:hypothetical protein